MRIHDSTSCMYVASCASSMFILTAVYPISRISTCLSVNCNLQVADYWILFDDDRYPASGCSLIKSGELMMMTVQRATNAERATRPGRRSHTRTPNSRASPPRTCWTTEPWSPAASIWRRASTAPVAGAACIGPATSSSGTARRVRTSSPGAGSRPAGVLHAGIGRARRQLAVRRVALRRRRPHAPLPAGRLRAGSGDPQGPGR